MNTVTSNSVKFGRSLVPEWNEGKWSYRSTYTVSGDGAVTGAQVLTYMLAQIAASTIGTPSGTKLGQVQPRETENHTVWECDVVFAPPTANAITKEVNPANDPKTTPLNRPADVSGGGGSTTESYFMDCAVTPVPVANTAGDPFEADLQHDRPAMSSVSYGRNYATNNPPAIDTLRQTLNAAAVTIDGISYAALTLRFREWSWQKVMEDWVNPSDNSHSSLTYYRRTYQLLHDPVRKHADWIGSYGYRQKVGGQLVTIEEKDTPGQRVARPQPLDSAGALATDGKAAKCVFQPYFQADWAPLGIS